MPETKSEEKSRHEEEEETKCLCHLFFFLKSELEKRDRRTKYICIKLRGNNSGIYSLFRVQKMKSAHL